MSMSKLLEAVKKAKQGGKSDREDQYFYYPARDAAKNGSAVIRFLPGKPDTDDVGFVQVYSHGFKAKATQKWLIENCPTTIGNSCAICAENSKLYASMSKDDARKYGMNRKNSFISRILVVEDKKNPENEGKVFLFKYGTKIFEKITDLLSPTFVDDDEKDEFIKKWGADAVDIFDLNTGANFKLKIREYEGNTNYDKSEFEAPSVCKLKVEYTNENDIMKFIAPEQFKDNEQLQRRFDLVMGNTGRVAPVDDVSAREANVPKAEKSKRVETKKSDDTDDDDILAMMREISGKSDTSDDLDDDIPF